MGKGLISDAVIKTWSNLARESFIGVDLNKSMSTSEVPDSGGEQEIFVYCMNEWAHISLLHST